MSTPVPASPSAVLWDMDGTLVDTEPYWMVAENELIAEWGGVWTHEDGLQLVGQGLWSSALVFQSRGVGLEPQQIIDTLTDRVLTQIAEHVPWRPGARELLAEVRAAGIRTALVTMSIRRMADTIIEALERELGGPAFEAVVAGDEVERPKPYPDAYLRAAELLAVPIEDCIAVEDSEPGVAAAVASGATTFAVPFHIPLPASPAYTLLEDGLADVGAAELVAGHVARRSAALARTTRGAR